MMTTLRTRQLTSLALLHLAITLSGCSPMVAQNPDTGLKPGNAVADGDDQRVLLTAHDPVAYFTEGRHRLGSSEHSSLYQGVRLRFASAEQKAPLDADPTQYLPPFGGYCANAIVCGIPWGGDADTWLIEDDRL